jgi:hypothetical protein
MCTWRRSKPGVTTGSLLLTDLTRSDHRCRCEQFVLPREAELARHFRYPRPVFDCPTRLVVQCWLDCICRGV